MHCAGARCWNNNCRETFITFSSTLFRHQHDRCYEAFSRSLHRNLCTLSAKLAQLQPRQLHIRSLSLHTGQDGQAGSKGCHQRRQWRLWQEGLRFQEGRQSGATSCRCHRGQAQLDSRTDHLDQAHVRGDAGLQAGRRQRQVQEGQRGQVCGRRDVRHSHQVVSIQEVAVVAQGRRIRDASLEIRPVRSHHPRSARYAQQSSRRRARRRQLWPHLAAGDVQAGLALPLGSVSTGQWLKASRQEGGGP